MDAVGRPPFLPAARSLLRSALPAVGGCNCWKMTEAPRDVGVEGLNGTNFPKRRFFQKRKSSEGRFVSLGKATRWLLSQFVVPRQLPPPVLALRSVTSRRSLAASSLSRINSREVWPVK
ncbi:ANK_REP_REGION domain-containing protein [Psidium guajava]|nr:ANK_REP_REGION domain-containing protein [Psidium guajava]